MMRLRLSDFGSVFCWLAAAVSAGGQASRVKPGFGSALAAAAAGGQASRCPSCRSSSACRRACPAHRVIRKPCREASRAGVLLRTQTLNPKP